MLDDEIILDTEKLLNNYDDKDCLKQWEKYLKFLESFIPHDKVIHLSTYIQEIKDIEWIDFDKKSIKLFIRTMCISLKSLYISIHEEEPSIAIKNLKDRIKPSNGFNGYYYRIGERTDGYSTVIEEGNEYMFPTPKEHMAFLCEMILYSFNPKAQYHKPGN